MFCSFSFIKLSTRSFGSCLPVQGLQDPYNIVKEPESPAVHTLSPHGLHNTVKTAFWHNLQQQDVVGGMLQLPGDLVFLKTHAQKCILGCHHAISGSLAFSFVEPLAVIDCDVDER